jgi:hypothetical protein
MRHAYLRRYGRVIVLAFGLYAVALSAYPRKAGAGGGAPGLGSATYTFDPTDNTVPLYQGINQNFRIDQCFGGYGQNPWNFSYNMQTAITCGSRLCIANGFVGGEVVAGTPPATCGFSWGPFSPCANGSVTLNCF